MSASNGGIDREHVDLVLRALSIAPPHRHTWIRERASSVALRVYLANFDGSHSAQPTEPNPDAGNGNTH